MKIMKENILIFLIDTQRADNLSCYGYPKKTTPNMDRIADEGVIFTNNIVPGVWTLPSHASLFTGRYVSGHGADVYHEFLSYEFPTLAEVLGKLGYRTVGFSNNGLVSRTTGIARGFDEYYLVRRPLQTGRKKTEAVEGSYVNEETPCEKEIDKGSLKTSNVAVRWIEDKYDGKQPFFMFINFLEPHAPYWPPEPFRSRFLPNDIDKNKVESARAIPRPLYGDRALTPGEWKIQKGLYDGCTATVDDRIGRLYNFLEEINLLDNAILIVTSDHGDVMDEHPPHAGHVFCAYDELVRVPLIVRYPRIFPEGREIRWVTQTLDIFPMILDILGVKEKEFWKTLQGHSILPALDDDPAREFALIEYNKALTIFYKLWERYPDYDIRRLNFQLKALRDLKHKYIWHSNGIDELYDLDEDPLEKKNVADDLPGVVKEMRSKMERVMLSIDRVDYGDWVVLGRRALENPAAKTQFERLKAWGFYRDIMTVKPPEEKDTYI